MDEHPSTTHLFASYSLNSYKAKGVHQPDAFFF